MYAADRKGTVKALNADDGKEVWSVNLAEKMAGSRARQRCFLAVTVSGGHVYIGSERSYALNTSDGTVARQTRVAGAVASGGERWHGAGAYQ